MDDTENLVPPGRLQTMQIVAGALLTGVLFFLAICLYLVWAQGNGQGLAPAQGTPLITIVAAGMLVVTTAMAFLVPEVLTRTALRQIVGGANRGQAGDAGQLLGLRATTLIVRCALLEGPAFMGCVAYLLEAHPAALGLVGVSVLLQLFTFPTRGRVQAWLEKQINRLDEMRLEGGEP